MSVVEGPIRDDRDHAQFVHGHGAAARRERTEKGQDMRLGVVFPQTEIG